MSTGRFSGWWYSPKTYTYFRQMSSDEDLSSPVLPGDSDQGSSVSSELQDEYEELLRYAVVTPKYQPQPASQLQLLSVSQLPVDGRSSRGNDEAGSHHSAVSEAEDRSRRVKSARTSPLTTEPRAQSHTLEGNEGLAGRLSVVSQRLQTPSERCTHSSPDQLVTPVTEMFISEENMNKMENVLDTWSDNLKANVLMELRKWKLAFTEQHRLEMRKERDKHAACIAGLNAEMDTLKELLHTYETSNQRKDEVIVNLSHVVDRQRERLELMKNFTHWRLQHSEAREKAHSARLAEQHYRLQLKRKVWTGWHALIQGSWKERVEKACRARAEEVCVHLSADYEDKIAEHVAAVEAAQAEISRLRGEREHYEETMKKAFMRGVCALNMEALSMFHPGEGRTDHHMHDAPPPQDDPDSGSFAHLQARPGSSAQFSPLPFEPPQPQSDAEKTACSSVPVSRAEAFPSTTVVHSTLPPGGTASSHRQVSSRMITSGQQKASKTVTARITARSDLRTPSSVRVPSHLQVMGVAPPMSSVVVERHHPVTQLTVGQATAAKFPRSSSSQQAQGPSSSKSSSRTNAAYHIHSIKVVD
ncbi:centrosomal protein POC5 isoform X1 [Esox lucius]|uniref:Centrosomal protein POC5 n=1 Tax=Esox lucius TaxID=8010 RepID=A0A3P8XYN7_ESOLU|nr:centrosomal protein POC5 isoform X1 [Esox lucius]